MRRENHEKGILILCTAALLLGGCGGESAPDIAEYKNFSVTEIENADGMLFCSSDERGIDPVHISTAYSVAEKTETTATILRTTRRDIYDNGSEINCYCYIELTNTPNGWRFDYFPMYDKYDNDVYADGTYDDEIDPEFLKRAQEFLPQ